MLPEVLLNMDLSQIMYWALFIDRHILRKKRERKIKDGSRVKMDIPVDELVE